ncbi:MAG: metallophosphoesterase [Planctomycetes bacterium]|nr:metallophosphoesterase [Planctomycetota bacterium]
MRPLLFCLAASAASLALAADPPALFIRGDANMNGRVDVSDAVTIVRYLFDDLPVTCLNALDVNNDTTLDLGDPLYLLQWLFVWGDRPPCPCTRPGIDTGGFIDYCGVEPLRLERVPFLQSLFEDSVAVVFTVNRNPAVPVRLDLGLAPGEYTRSFEGLGSINASSIRADGLTPDTTYYYRLFGEGHSLMDAPPEHSPDEFRIRTAPPRGSQRTIRFAQFGDGLIPEVADAIGQSEVDFVLFTGDTSQIDPFVSPPTPFPPPGIHFYPHLGRMRAPVWPALGDDDWENTSFMYGYFAEFVLPDHSCLEPGLYCERYYSFDYGDAHVCVLDTNEGGTSEFVGPLSSQQLAWLETDLQQANAKWIIACFHRPIYAGRGLYGGSPNHRSQLEPIFVRFGVDVVFSGHESILWRSKPVKNQQVVAESDENGDYRNPGAPIYVVCGTGGGVIYPYEPGVGPWEAWIAGETAFTLTEISGDTLRVEFVEPAGRTVLHRFSITKD